MVLHLPLRKGLFLCNLKGNDELKLSFLLFYSFRTLLLENLGFEIIDDKKSKLIDAIKTQIIELIHHQKEALHINLSDFLSRQLKHDYSYLSNLFSEKEGITIEKYFITQKIEKVKELLIYDELSLSEIAYQLNYSSVAHLSSQFKKVTGLTPSFFKNLKGNKRIEIEKL
ncbi:helix-turn-helix transcriptional regulator [Pedobacter aquae]|uniref:Helix-turn-helix transcriptional regulator n=1 Tax=Pedobacter aquae TaxID=2605747 RepID=A0A5C0VPN7_9SPHI|nr:helix-turn-helix transcriptional regulator [Pedobacter aquae]